MTEKTWLNGNQLSLDIWNNKYRFKDESFDQWLDRVSGGNQDIRELIKEKKFLFGGRTLANRGIKDTGSYSNCYSRGFIDDSIDGIMQASSDIAKTFKAQGGQGLSLTKIRPKGCPVKGGYESDGIVPFMHIFNTITESISQGGSRKGALLMSLSVEHPEIETFITIKEDPNEINKANLSVEINDEFMENLNKGTTYTPSLEWKNYVTKDIDPKKIFSTIAKSAWKSAEPGIIYTNRFRNYNLMEFIPEYSIETCNPCGEQPLAKNSACNLCSINLSEYVINPFMDNCTIDWDNLKKDIFVIVKAMDDVLEENLSRHALPEQKAMAEKYRNVGIGVMGLSDFLVKCRLTYGSPNSVNLIRNLMREIFRTAVQASVELAKERGNFPGYSPKVWDSHIIEHAFSTDEIKQFKKIDKLRNCSLLSIAPTGSLGTMLNIGTGCEPFFAVRYTRRTVSLNKEEVLYDVNVKALDEYREITGNNDTPSYFITAGSIPWKQRVNMQAAMQEYVDTAISSTVNLGAFTTVEDIEGIYKYAWEKGLKGITVFRDGSRQGILTTSESKEESEELERGIIIPSSNNCLGIKRTLSTGCGSLHAQCFFDNKTGDLREIYLSKGSTGGCNNFMISLSRMISLAARGGVKVDSILDQLKSCGVCPSYAVRSATKNDTSKGSSCPVAIGNAVRDMYNEMQEIICKCNGSTVENKSEECDDNSLEECPNCHKKTLIHSGGCIQCNSCGFSRCN